MTYTMIDFISEELYINRACKNLSLRVAGSGK